uniref:Uncharacterized protein n=1 Tax=viral metagenome TaxID=1070528 RepID=A0A6M3IYF2_9ZZZZ
MEKSFKCDYRHDPDCEYGEVDLGCLTCIREKNRTCPTGIYDDTIIDFGNIAKSKEEGNNGDNKFAQ